MAHFARVREIVVAALAETTAKHRFARSDTRNQIASVERSEHNPGGLSDSWYVPPNEDTPGWRGPARIATANDGEANITVRFQGETLDRRHQEVRAHVPCLVH